MTILQSEIRRILDKTQIAKNASRNEISGLYIPTLVQSNSFGFYKTAKLLSLDIKVQSNIARIQSDGVLRRSAKVFVKTLRINDLILKIHI